MKPISHAVDEARLGIMPNELRLPMIKTLWPRFAEQADREGWPAARFLAAIAEHELAERAHRRIGRHLAEAHLPPGKTLDSFAFEAVPVRRANSPPGCLLTLLTLKGPGHGHGRRRQLAGKGRQCPAALWSA